MPSVHNVERTDLIFVHSEVSACPRWVRVTGIGEVYDAPGAPCQWGAAAVGCGIGGWGVLIGVTAAAIVAAFVLLERRDV
ncbi:hypothetical protein [Streptomyces sp. ME109]|uniref:hypothetical protein n=1 Tax=Streptomyces sp. me109 TaxID=1827853 RepID=UPI0016516257|nr:hypothetical protein [Streptomyces sp. me109]